MLEHVVARAIITDDEGRVLLGLRARGQGANQWALVGGKPDNSETPVATIKREVSEELGVGFEPVFYLQRVDDITDPQHPWHVYYFTGHVLGEITIKEDEIKEVKYFSKEEVMALDIAFDHKERLLDFFKSHLSSASPQQDDTI
jgi:8-oxo-dGTP pyrophosphatase MutT (NUDIX family)